MICAKCGRAHGERTRKPYHNSGMTPDDYIVVRGERNPDAKLVDAQVAEVRRLYAEGFTQQTLADMYGVSQMLISKKVRHK